MSALIIRFLVAVFAAAVAPLAHGYPDRHVTMVIGWAPGGSTDVFARLIAAKLSEKLGQSVVVVNKPGASGTIGAQFAANERADGYTLYYGTNSTYALAPWLYKSLPYDFTRAFAPVSFIGSMPMIVGVHPGVPARDIGELVGLARQSPGRVTFGSSSPGSTSHIAAELFMAYTRTELLHVPYKGGGPAMAALLGGEIQMLFNDIATLESLMKAGKVRGLAITSATRVPQLPDLPTVAESGFPGFEVSTTNALFAPKATPPEIIEQIRSALTAVLNEPAMAQELLRRGLVVQPSTPAELAAHLGAEQQKWRSLLETRNITLAQ